MGTVEAVSTPAATTPAHHRLSFAGDVHADLEPASAPPRTASNSLLLQPPPSATTDAALTRSSYMTNETGTSRMSGLSDFPAPPSQVVVSPGRVEMLQSYFAPRLPLFARAEGADADDHGTFGGPSQLSLAEAEQAGGAP
ncbi:hypothetical protein BC834DRAFT_875928 [Gloeopeniophorella convolvens]|nr:hypothetical protein BC834DRAFT_875928 [Gloeopeniophorella convolvens]